MAQRILIPVLAICLFASGPAFAQQAGNSAVLPMKLREGPELIFESLAFAPHSRVRPDGLVTVRSTVKNSGGDAAVGYLVGRVDGQAGHEDRRRISLGPGEKKVYEVQLRLPKDLPGVYVDVSMTLNVLEGDREILVHDGDQPVARTLRLPIDLERSITAIRMNDPPKEQVYWRWPPTKTYSTYEMVAATRIDASLSRISLGFEQDPFPLRLSDWNCIDLLVIASPAAFDDVASVGMMQQFVQSGRRIWIMLDQIDTTLVRELLSDDQQLETVDTVKLNRFEIDVPGKNYDVADRIVDSDETICMKRVIQQGGQVTQSVGGWPIVIRMPAGKGEIVFTTLDSSAWLKKRTQQTNADPTFQAAFTLPIWSSTFALNLHEPKKSPSLDLQKTTYAIEQIGNPVVSRNLVALILLSFSGCWVALGTWRAAGGKVRFVGLIAPGLAILASLPLIAASTLQRQEIPSMVAVLQIAEIDSRAGTLVREAAAVYLGDSSSMELIGQGDGTSTPSDKIDSGIRSITTDDYQKWRMVNPVWPSGTWRYWTHFSVPDQTSVAESHFTNEGLIVDLPISNSILEDIVVSMVPGAPVIGKKQDENRILIRGDMPAEGERWTVDSIVSEEQLRRASVYRELFEDRFVMGVAPRTICGWSGLLSHSPKWNVELVRRGSSLQLMQVRVATPEVGSTIRIPYSLIRIEHSNWDTSSVVFNQSTGRFIDESTLNAQADLAFVLPPEAVPLQVSSIDIDWDIRAPERTAKLSCSIDGKMVTLAELKDPSLPYRTTIRDANVLHEWRDGRLELRLEVLGNDVLNLGERNYVSWQIKHLRLTVNGDTLPRNRLVNVSDK